MPENFYYLAVNISTELLPPSTMISSSTSSIKTNGGRSLAPTVLFRDQAMPGRAALLEISISLVGNFHPRSRELSIITTISGNWTRRPENGLGLRVKEGHQPEADIG